MHDQSNRDQGGCPHYDVIVLMKMLVLLQWHVRSDFELERLAEDGISSHHITGFPATIPDRSTIRVFKNRPVDAGRSTTSGPTCTSSSTPAAYSSSVVHVGSSVSAIMWPYMLLGPSHGPLRIAFRPADMTRSAFSIEWNADMVVRRPVRGRADTDTAGEM
jgi:hypothetical protein